MPFNASITELIRYVPYKTDAAGNVTETMPAVLVRIDEPLLAEIRALLTTNTQRTQFDSWTRRWTDAQCAEWNVPVWAGETSATFLAIPNTIWSRWDAAVPATVKTRFGRLYREDV